MTPRRHKTIAELGEFGLIAKLTEALPVHPALELGIGDDAAILKRHPERLLVTTDLLVEDVHFRRSTTSAADLGHKSLAVNLSDIAAMGGRPLAAFISLALPKSLPVSWATALYRGMRKLADECGVALAGGDTTGSPGPIIINVALIGMAQGKTILRRDGAHQGNSLWVCGDLGYSAAGLHALENGLRAPAAFRLAHKRPQARLAEGLALAKSGRCTSCLDVSDGLLGDLQHILDRSGIGAEIDLAALPIPANLQRFANRHKLDPLQLVLNGGEDYALLFTLTGKRAPTPWPKTAAQPRRIGCITETSGQATALLPDGQRIPLSSSSWNHFTND